MRDREPEPCEGCCGGMARGRCCSSATVGNARLLGPCVPNMRAKFSLHPMRDGPSFCVAVVRVLFGLGLGEGPA